MEFAFVGRLIAACAVIALVLVAVNYGARFALRANPLGPTRTALLAVVETAYLPGAASLHVVRVVDRYYVLGRSGTHIATLAEIPADDVASARSAPPTTGFAAHMGLWRWQRQLRRRGAPPG